MNRGKNWNPLRSHLNPHTAEHFLKTKPKALVTRLHDLQKRCIEVVVRCRNNSLTWGIPLPVFCALDDIQNFEDDHINDADFFYVSRPKCGLIDMIPYTGARWYSKYAVHYLLETKRITLSHVKFSLKATGHLEPDAFERPFKSLSRCGASAKRIWRKRQ